jgi:hypothetical protein
MGRETKWNPEKNEQLRLERRLSFEDVVAEMEAGRILDDFDHPVRAGQRILAVEIGGYVCAVPYVQDRNTMFLKTIYRDRNLNRKYREPS